MSADVEMATIECVHCHASVDDSVALRLFDGRWYCRACVEGESPALAEYAATHDFLDDQITYDVKAIGLCALFYSLLPGISTFVVLELVDPWPGINSLVVLPITLVVVAPLEFLFFLLVAQVRFPRTIVVDSGQLQVFTQLQSRQYELRDCEWRIRRAGIGALPDGIMPSTQLVAIYVPFWRRRLLLLACQNDRSRELWMHFLKLSGVPEHR